MAGWNTTDFNWDTLSTFYNAPPGLLLNDLLAAATERWNVLHDTDILDSYDVGDNAPLDVNEYNTLFMAVLSGVGENRFTRPVSGSSYDYTNAPDMPYWDIGELVSSIGPFPANGKVIENPYGPDAYFYEANAPLTAEWCKWWYEAMNKLVRVEYRDGLLRNAFSQEKEHTSAVPETYAEAKSAWEAEDWSTPVISPNAGANQDAKKLGHIDGFTLGRYRSITNQSVNQWKPYQYAGNYTLSVWSKFFEPSKIYENPDYPCSNDTYAQVEDDETVRSGVYVKDVKFGYFDTITLSEPQNNGDEHEWNSYYEANHCRFDISGGFEYVAP